MKNIYLLCLASLLFCYFPGNTQVFVNQNAAGANDGSSWANAYLDLSDALSAAQEGDEIWVAAGSYRPGGDAPTVDASFAFLNDLQLYGGFAGIEAMLSERDWTANETILSGDHAGDDIDGNFTTNREDNSLHVIFLSDTITNASSIDGFTIRNGSTQTADGSGDGRRGGAILTYGNPSIRNCTFTQNYGHFGGAIYPRGTDAIVIEDCTFIDNTASWGGAGIYINSEEASISRCSFIGGNAITRRGGGIASFGCAISVTDCTFENNNAGDSSAGALHIDNDEDEPMREASVTNCVFTNNNATFGGALACYGEMLVVTVNDCEFSNNLATTIGGAMTNAFGVTATIVGCTFNENECTGTGGAVYSQNDSSSITIINTMFASNSAERGGAIGMGGDNDPTSTTPLKTLILENVILVANLATEQAGGVNISNANLDASNTLFDTNIATNVDGIGGAISLNTSDSIHTTFSILNSTLVSNSASIGAGISNWKPDEMSTSVLTLQNTIINSPFGLNYEIEAGSPSVISSGGNLSTDATLVDYLVGTNDLNETDPLFVSMDDQDYHLMGDSPCVDTGITDGAPPLDIEGVARMGNVDMGAYEYQSGVGVADLNQYFGELSIYPNPVKEDLNFAFTSVWRGQITIQLTNQEGKIIHQQMLAKNDKEFARTFDVSQLPAGMYNLSISNGRLVNTQSFVK